MMIKLAMANHTLQVVQKIMQNISQKIDNTKLSISIHRSLTIHFLWQLHIYVKNKLKAKYGADKFPATGHIPAHLLGKQ